MGKNLIVTLLAIIGGLFALIPALLSVNYLLFHEGSGEPGPALPYITPPFILVLPTFAVFGGVFLILTALDNELIIFLVGGILNVLLWIFIGAGVGWLIKRRKEKRVRIILILLGLIILVLGFLSRKFIGYSMFRIAIIISVFFIGYPIIKIIEGSKNEDL